MFSVGMIVICVAAPSDTLPFIVSGTLEEGSYYVVRNVREAYELSTGKKSIGVSVNEITLKPDRGGDEHLFTENLFKPMESSHCEKATVAAMKKTPLDIPQKHS